ncbi:hypothetical protein D3C72_1753060 [compost metagenome]
MRLDRLNGEVAADVFYAGQLQQGVQQELLVGAQVRHHHLQQEVGLAGHQVGGDDFPQGADFLPELFGVPFVVALDLDAHEYSQPQADFMRVEPCFIALDDAGLFHHPHPPQAGRGGKADLFGQLHIGQAPVLLQGFKNAPVVGVEFVLWHGVRSGSMFLVRYANNGREVGMNSKHMPTRFS